MKPSFFLLLIIFLNACTISTIQDRENITTYDPTVDISHIEFQGGDGSSLANAVVILKARTSTESLASEYAYLKKKFGEPNSEWKLLQIRSKDQKNEKFDVLKIKDLDTDSIHTFYFNTSSFKGKS